MDLSLPTPKRFHLSDMTQKLGWDWHVSFMPRSVYSVLASAKLRTRMAEKGSPITSSPRQKIRGSLGMSENRFFPASLASQHSSELELSRTSTDIPLQIKESGILTSKEKKTITN
ncbi:hypothetical protein AVEN_259937-1 [Araneus ventricosus]|uniref:Uncharacterized protein n=1 Tax=Araneus ventricosus TaxID=182803 RepID=A0A4Y2GRJ0_ARAVE|nr:hypothetical protein AVEN_259937-1 [Araneus ventricosus]